MRTDRRQYLTVLGSTGSIGVSTLDVVARHPDRYRVYALTANSRIEGIFHQCMRFYPEVAVVGTDRDARALEGLLRQKGLKTTVTYGLDALCAVACAPQTDTVMAAIVGSAGLAPALAAAQAGKKLLLANKEALVMSGQLFMDAVSASHATLLPIDSEHNAIFQCLPLGCTPSSLASCGVKKVLLTASGGPFLHRSVETLDAVTPEQAVAHPKWAMGRKISVDSATMMNKGLEVIEAHWLFGIPPAQIEVLVHPQSIVHSMVAYVDGSVIAQMANPDMRVPIAYALAYPDRIASGVAPLDLAEIGRLQFEKPDDIRFPCLRLAYQALRAGGTMPAVLNAANEVAVQAFLEKRIGFRKIADIVARVLDMIHAESKTTGLDGILMYDRVARQTAGQLIFS
ncbi:MAG: 1-deoxy-D-xylulose-5-phosphate reductoisomerase [Burkholderiaceae bacterium]|jgi:1-deoxy-D-xylulose-5-phosphate reductoisomerase|nr:1-deoxy-D-xylulose-5-phosphate reductoisomerase [Burkholderiaceae bacterium]